MDRNKDAGATADVVLVPSTEASGDGPGRAERIVLAACPDAAPRVRRVPFSMGDRTGVTRRRAAAWETSAAEARAAFEQDLYAVLPAPVPAKPAVITAEVS